MSTDEMFENIWREWVSGYSDEERKRGSQVAFDKRAMRHGFDQAPNQWCYDMDKAPKNKRLIVWVDSDFFGPVDCCEIRTLKTGEWVGHEGEQWANDHGGIRTKDPVYSAWCHLPPAPPQEVKNAE